MASVIEGRCRCGACNYTLALDNPPPVYACHCHICQRASGSAFSLQALVREDQLGATGSVIVQEIVTEDRTSVQRFCGACLARIYNTNTRRPGIAVVRAGTLDRSEELVCRAHIFTNDKQGWITLDPALPHWGEAAALDALVGALLAQ